MSAFKIADKVTANFGSRMGSSGISVPTGEGEIVSVFPGTAFPYAVRFPGNSRPILMQAVELQKAEPPVTITMTAKQAESLMVVLNCVGGSPKGRRGDIDKVVQSLKAAGIENDHDIWVNEMLSTARSIFFKQ